MILMGIDAGSGNNCGVAIYHTKTKVYLKIAGMHLIDLLELMDKEAARVQGVLLEDPNIDKTTFRTGKNKNISMKMAQDAGKNMAIASIIKEKCKRLEWPLVLIAPSERRRADKSNKALIQLNMPTKTTQKEFRLLTGHAKSTNEHGRDAATLVWGMYMADFEKLYKEKNKR